MKLHETIRKRRKEQNLTQEQVAERLGVTGSAVHKWETGASCPDIALLPPLARLLGVDLNTLLSFEEELTDREAALFLNDLQAVLEQEGYEAAFAMAMDKLREYPASAALMGNVAMWLDGARIMYQPEDPAVHGEEIEALYRRVAQCDRPELRDMANYMLVFKYADRGEWEQAEAIMETLPERTAMDRTTVRTALLMRQEKGEEASKLAENTLFCDLTAVCSGLARLLGLRLKAGAEADAEELAALSEQMAELFGLPPLVALTGRLELALHRKDAAACVALLESILAQSATLPSFEDSPLFRHLNHQSDSSGVSVRLGKALATSAKTDERLDFLRDDPSFQALLTRYQA